MKFFLIALSVLLAAPLSSFAQRREYVQLQRDIALLQDQLRSLQRSMDENKDQTTLLIQQVLESVNKANTSIVVLENSFRDRLREQEKNVGRPVATIGSKVDQATTELQAVKENLAELTVRFGRLEQQMVDTANAVKTLQAPPPPPGSGTQSPAGEVSAETLYQNALRDKQGGNLDLALKEFNEYLEAFGSTELAPNAQYYIGEIHYLRDNFAEAVTAFDLVLEKYQENAKTPDAHYMKGMALIRMGQRNNGRDEFYTLIRRFPNNPLAAKAKDTLKGLGLPARPSSKR